MVLNKLIEVKNNNEKIAIIGLGVENKQFVKWLINVFEFNPANIIVIDQNKINDDYEFFDEIKEFVVDKEFDYINKNVEIKLVIKSPGIWSNKPSFEQFRMTNGQDSVISSLSFFIEKYRENIIAVTGTKGKTTTSSLIKHLLNPYHNVEYCGNSVGLSPYNFWNVLDQKVDDTIFILELSSFQLHDLGRSKISPKVAICTNLYIDHQDIHNGVQEYWDAKENIYRFQTPSDALIISDQIKKIDRFKNGINTYLVDDNFIDNFKKTVSLDNIKISGKHNESNISMAVLACAFYESGKVIDDNDFEAYIQKNKDRIEKLLSTFEPVEFRCQKVHNMTYNDIKFDFYNDMQGTTPESTFYAVNSLSEKADEGVVLMTGSKAKTDDYSLIINLIKQKLENKKMLDLLLFDEIGEIIKKEIEGNNYAISTDYPTNTRIFFENGLLDLEEYAIEAKERGFKKINILISPLGSSFNEFKNYKEKGEMFNEWVKGH